MFSSKKSSEDYEQRTRNDYDRIRRELTDQMRVAQDELQQTREQLDSLKSSRPQAKQVGEENQRFVFLLQISLYHCSHIRRLRDELERTKSLLEHHRTQLNILEHRIPAGHGNRSNNTKETY